MQNDKFCEENKTSNVMEGASQVALVVKKTPANAGDLREFGKIPWRRAQQPTPVFLPGESHEQRSLEGHSPWGRTESDRTEAA